MSAIGIVTVVGIVAVVVLFLILRKRRSLDVVEELMNKRRGSAKAVTRANFVQGRERMAVALALTDSQLFYENANFQAQLELSRIDEVEYDDEVSTGQDVEDGRVLRLRSHGQTIEFILSRGEADRLASLLPPHRMDEPGKVHVV